jgi:hypothetical protein
VLRKRRDELGWGKAVRFRVVRPAPDTEHSAVSSEAIPLSIPGCRLPRLCPVPPCLVAQLGVGSYEIVLLTLPFIFFLLSLENEWACYHQNPLMNRVGWKMASNHPPVSELSPRSVDLFWKSN